MSDRRRTLLIWLAAAYLFALTDPFYPLFVRGWSEWATDYDGVRNIRRLVWAGHYVVIGVGLLLMAREAGAAIARQALLPVALLWFGASALWSHAPGESAMGFAQFALTLTFGMAAAVRFGPAAVAAALFRAGIICAVASWAVAAFAPLYGFGQHVNPGSLRGVYAEKNHLAIFLSYAIAAGVFEALTTPRRSVLLGLGLVVGTALAARSTIGVGQMVMALLAASLFFGLGRVRHGGFAALSIAVAALLALAAILPAALAAFGEDATLNGRTSLWAMLWPMIDARPVLGYGFAGFWSTLDSAPVRDAVGWNLRGAHSGWVETLLAGGVVGAVLWLACWIGVAARALAALRPGSDPAPAALALIALTQIAWSCFESHQMTYLNYHAVIAGFAFSLAAAGRATGRTGDRCAGRNGTGTSAAGPSASVTALRTKSGLPTT